MMDRRTFITKFPMAVGVSGFCTLPFVVARLLAPNVAAAAESRIPLPGALADHGDFINACIGCGMCAEVCPPDCIRFHMNDGGKAAHTPYIDPVEKGCILCGLCMHVCPTEALTITPIRDVKMGIAQIDRSACYPWVDRGVCGACINICPLGSDAIQTDPGTFRPVILSGCVGCGLCVEICPEPSLPIKIVDYSLSTKKQAEAATSMATSPVKKLEKNTEKNTANPDQKQIDSSTGELKF